MSVTWNSANDMLTSRLHSQLDRYHEGFNRYQPGRVLLPKKFATKVERIRNFEVRDSDVWLCGYPKTGTTWVQELLWLLKNDLNFEAAKKEPLNRRSPLFELGTLIEDALPSPDGSPATYLDLVEITDILPSPRIIKSHLPWNLAPEQLRTSKAKMIYLCRNPKDVCVSFYHHHILLEGYTGNFQEFCEYFLGNTLLFAPFWDHVLGFWQQRKKRDILFLKYEEMKKDFPTQIRRVAKFLEQPLSDEQVGQLEEHLSVESMRSNPSTNFEDVLGLMKHLGYRKREEGEFVRKGEAGDWKVSMNAETAEKFDKWTKSYIKDTDFKLLEE